jgi:hypothetical protein
MARKVILTLLALFGVVAAVPAADNFIRKWEVVTPGYSYYSCGVRYSVADVYGWNYYAAPAAPAYVAPKAPAYTPDWKTELAKYAAARDAQQAKVLREGNDHRAYLDALAAVGLNGQTLNFQQASYSYFPAVGTYGAQGNTVYGYQSTTTYGTAAAPPLPQLSAVDLNALYLQGQFLAKGSRESMDAIHAKYFGLIDAQAGYQTRLAEIREKAIAAERVLRAAAPADSSTTTTVNQGTGFRPQTRRTMPPADRDRDSANFGAIAEAFLVRTGRPLCAKCHSGSTLQGDSTLRHTPPCRCVRSRTFSPD